MADTYIIQLDMDRMRDQCSRLGSRPCSVRDVQQWLVDHGFYPRIDGLYLAEEALLAHLDPGVILEKRPVGTQYINA